MPIFVFVFLFFLASSDTLSKTIENSCPESEKIITSMYELLNSIHSKLEEMLALHCIETEFLESMHSYILAADAMISSYEHFNDKSSIIDSSSQAPLLFDCFIYNGELLAFFRITYLYEFVDKFIIVEAWETHSGIRKPKLYFDIHKNDFEMYKEKIIFLVIDQFPSQSEEALQSLFPWMKPENRVLKWREMYQRDFAQNYLQTVYTPLSVQYIAIVSDVDEIPRREILRQCLLEYDVFSASVIYLEMEFYYYNFDWKKDFKWCKAFMVNRESTLTNSWSFNRLSQGNEDKFIRNAGWHLSFFTSKEDIRRKLSSFIHKEYDLEELKSIDHIQACLKEGKDLMGRSAEDLVYTKHNTTNPDLPVGWENLQAYLKALQELD